MAPSVHTPHQQRYRNGARNQLDQYPSYAYRLFQDRYKVTGDGIDGREEQKMQTSINIQKIQKSRRTTGIGIYIKALLT